MTVNAALNFFVFNSAAIQHAARVRNHFSEKSSYLMKSITSALIISAALLVSHLASATQADDTTITIDSQIAGVTPFISQLTLTASDTTVIKQIQFTVTPKAGSVTRPLSGTYSQQYMIDHGYLVPPSMRSTVFTLTTLTPLP